MKFNMKFLKKKHWVITIMLLIIFLLFLVYYYYSSDFIEGVETSNLDKHKITKPATDEAKVINMLITSHDKCHGNGNYTDCIKKLASTQNIKSLISGKTMHSRLKQYSPEFNKSKDVKTNAAALVKNKAQVCGDLKGSFYTSLLKTKIPNVKDSTRKDWMKRFVPNECWPVN